jgi:hypothetical protein
MQNDKKNGYYVALFSFIKKMQVLLPIRGVARLA